MSSAPNNFQHQTDLIGIFAQHKVAANLFMFILVLAGFWGLSKLNTQFLPTFALDMISVRVVWSGASAEDIERAITRPIEQELRNLDSVKKISSTATNGIAAITLEYYEGTDMMLALDQAKQQITLMRNLPSDAEKPEVSRIIRYEAISSLLLSGDLDGRELRHLARKMERELLQRGIAKVDIKGLPDEEIAVMLPPSSLAQLNLNLNQVGQKIKQYSQDLPVGYIGKDSVSRQLRTEEQRESVHDFAQLPLLTDANGQYVRLGDVAEIERRAKPEQMQLSYQNRNTLELVIYRAENGNTLQATKTLKTWLADTRPTLPKTVELREFNETWKVLQGRIDLLIDNGIMGLLLVVVILYLFLNGRVAWWVALGIPISLLATQAALYLLGGSINMISLFAMIMALGIVVDDAIVVGEDALTHYQIGERSLMAAEGGARRMFTPVMASSLTTIAVFLPLMLISGTMGQILSDIPLVMVCVILASTVECFLILPGHLHHSFHAMHLNPPKPSKLRQILDQSFENFKEKFFRPIATWAVHHHSVMISLILSLFIVTVGLLAGGRLNFTFFPSPDGTLLDANISFVAGTPAKQVRAFVAQVEQALYATEKSVGEKVIILHTVKYNQAGSADGLTVRRGEQFAQIMVELHEPDSRKILNDTFIQLWRTQIPDVAGLENLTIASQRSGPPGRDIDIRLSGATSIQLKQAALALSEKLKTFDGVSGIEDDMPFGREQVIYRLKPLAVALGLTLDEVNQQLRAAFEGQLVQIFLDQQDEVEVRVMLSDDSRYQLNQLNSLPLRLPNGDTAALENLLDFHYQRGFEALRHFQGELTVQVSASVDKNQNNSNKIISELNADYLPLLASEYGIKYQYEGRSAEQKETLGDMKLGVAYALALIYLVLAWVFSSYGWPLLVMLIIPLGLVGALWGHWWLHMDLTILSLFGIFALSGIVVNDAIVLVSFYQELRQQGMAVKAALIEASCQRLRAVLLTSLTTIGGLMPLVFETSLQAQFLIPMAVSLSFGLMFSTVLVLLMVPALLAAYERHEPIKGD